MGLASKSQTASTSKAGPGDVLRRIVRQAALSVGAEEAFVALRDANDANVLVVAASHGSGTAELPGRRFGLDEGLAGRAVAEEGPQVVGGGRRFTRESEGPEGIGGSIQAAAAVPLRAGGRVRGALAVATTDPDREFGELDLEVLDGLADLAATMLSALSGRSSGTRGATKPGEGAGHDRHALAAALGRFERIPALAESRDRLNAAIASSRPLNGEAIAAIESDIGLCVAVLRAANEVSDAKPGASVPKAIEVLGRPGLKVVVERLPVVDFFSRSAPERFRAHALAVQRAAERLADMVGYPLRDELAVSALLHDVGKLVLAAAYPEHIDAFRPDLAAPDARAKAERHDLGLDHAMVGGVMVRRWGLPDRLAATVERHHSDTSGGEAGIVRLADMLAHYGHGRPVDPAALLAVSRAVGLDPTQLRSVLYELPSGGTVRRGAEASPLTPKEHAALQGLAIGQRYKEIAATLGVTTSTVRSHLHSTYKKLGAADRAQAVLIATERGWL